MTLLVTERSPLGIVMLADTKGEFDAGGQIRRESGFGKIVYNAELNVAVGGWGKASIGRQRLDRWLAAFLQSSVAGRPSVRVLGETLVEQANSELAALGRSWPALGRRGVHIAGFEDGLAALYHAHMGPEEGPVGPLRLEDTVEVEAKKMGISRATAMCKAKVQLRNGIYPSFIEVWDRDVALSGWGDMSSLAARAEHYPPIFRAVAYESQSIDSEVSLIAFSPRGVEVAALVSGDSDASREKVDWNENMQF